MKIPIIDYDSSRIIITDYESFFAQSGLGIADYKHERSRDSHCYKRKVEHISGELGSVGSLYRQTYSLYFYPYNRVTYEILFVSDNKWVWQTSIDSKVRMKTTLQLLGSDKTENSSPEIDVLEEYKFDEVEVILDLLFVLIFFFCFICGLLEKKERGQEDARYIQKYLCGQTPYQAVEVMDVEANEFEDVPAAVAEPYN